MKWKIICLLLLSFRVVSQVTLVGAVTQDRYNGTPISNVKISTTSANPTTTNNFGQFVLNFDKKKAGDFIIIQALKEGWEVINILDLNIYLRNNPDSNPIKIVLCRKGERDKKAITFYEIEAENIISQDIRNTKNDIKRISNLLELEVNNSTALRDSLNILRKQLEQQYKYKTDRENLAEIAKSFANINIGDVDQTYLQAYDLFKRGEIAEMQTLLNPNIIEDNIKIAEDLEIKSKKIKEKSINQYFLKIQGFLRQGQPDSVIIYCKRIFKIDSANINARFQYASVLSSQNRINEAIEVYGTLLNRYRQLASINPNLHLPTIASILLTIGVLKNTNHEIRESRLCLNESINLFESLISKDSLGSLRQKANGYFHLSNNYSSNFEFELAEKYAYISVEIYEKIITKLPNDYLTELANIYTEIAAVLTDKKTFTKAEEYFSNALKSFEKVEDKTAPFFLESKCKFYSNFGNYLFETRNFAEAKKCYMIANDLSTQLVRENENKYSYILAYNLIHLGRLYYQTIMISESQNCYEKALNIYRELIVKNRNAYIINYYSALTGLALVKISYEHYEEASNLYNEAFIFIDSLSKNNEKDYLLYKVTILEGIASLKLAQKKFIEAEKDYQYILAIYINSNMSTPEINAMNIALTYMNLGISQKHNLIQAEKNLKRSYIMFDSLYKLNHLFILPDFIKLLNHLSTLYRENERKNDAESILLLGVSILRENKEISSFLWKSLYSALLLELGNLKFKERNIKEARKYYFESLDIYIVLYNEVKLFVYFEAIAEIFKMCSIIQKYDTLSSNSKRFYNSFK